MKILKLQLHWQILIALILAIVYGIIFPTSYIIRDHSYESLTRNKADKAILNQLKSIEGKVYKTQDSFQNEVKSLIGEEVYKKNSSTILKAAYQNQAINAVSWLGIIFLKALKMLIIPLILSSLISGITNIGSGSNLGRLGLKTFGYYVMTSLFAIVTGLFLVNIIKPGVGADLNLSATVEGLEEKRRSFIDIIVDIVPENIFQAFNENQMLSIIFFAILFGFFITQVDDKYRISLKNAFNGIFEVMMKLTMFVIKFTPLGIFGIVSKTVADQDDLLGLLSSMGLYMGTVVAALSIHFFITLPLIAKYIGKVHPFQHMKNMATPLITAFSTASSGATLPLTMTAVEKNSGVSNKISSFTLPLGATINMDGTALYECVAAMFIAQAYGADISVLGQVIIVFTALLASIGAAAIPMAGLVMIAVILTAVNLPLEGIGLILAVDQILDMFRTATNVWSDSCGAVIIAKSEGEELLV
ncbi:MAG: dicarboxylate/amino acid:cation symporter [Bacteroidales bacterium]|nr:dicarboxylate/amino acid:cation symporter [Bacteroidales bacterium]MCF8403556.1 dicarboxylate/amino acid:cation symporter [Bacteroidales bacterium]